MLVHMSCLWPLCDHGLGIQRWDSAARASPLKHGSGRAWSAARGGGVHPGCSHISGTVLLRWWQPLPGGREALWSDLTDVCLKEQREGTDITVAPVALQTPYPVFGDFSYRAQRGGTVAMLMHPDESTGVWAQIHWKENAPKVSFAVLAILWLLVGMEMITPHNGSSWGWCERKNMGEGETGALAGLRHTVTQHWRPHFVICISIARALCVVVLRIQIFIQIICA